MSISEKLVRKCLNSEPSKADLNRIGEAVAKQVLLVNKCKGEHFTDQHEILLDLLAEYNALAIKLKMPVFKLDVGKTGSLFIAADNS